MEGIIFNIKRFAIHDGPGIRTTVFFKGCPLNCLWCHNPESKGDAVCCPSNNRERRVSSEDLFHEIDKDRIFYEESGGGVTFSGGEPLLQCDFLKEMLIMCKKMDIHTVLDTTGYCSEYRFLDIVDVVDLFLFDLKLMDNKEHEKYTGLENSLIHTNFKHLSRLKKPCYLRIPLISGITDTDDNIDRMIECIKDSENILQVNLLPYHTLGEGKLKQSGEIRLSKLKAPDDKRIIQIKQKFEKYSFKVKTGG